MFLLPLFVLPSVVFGALQLPTPPYLPPPAASGAVASLSKSPNDQWTNLLGNLLYFYEAQRSGTLPKDNRVTWRNNSGLNDGSDLGLDLTGGYYDAGDYIKCTFPLSFTLTSICWGALDFGAGYDQAKQTAYLNDMLRWGLDWLIKAHPNPNTLITQVGDTNIDNDYWGGDSTLATPRPSFEINSTSPGTDAAASASAAFSMCSMLYSNTTLSTFSQPSTLLSDQNYSTTLLLHASDLYTFASSNPSSYRTYIQSNPALGDTYPSSGYQDDLTLAALALGIATNSSQLISSANSFYSKYSLSSQNGVLNWDSKTPMISILFSQSAFANGGDNKWQVESERYLDNIITISKGKKGQGGGYLTKGGLLYYPGDSDEASLNPALNAAMLMGHYAPMASTKDKGAAYMNFANSQLNYTLGNNPMSAPYIVGSNPNSPSNPSSALASGGNSVDTIDTVPKVEAYVLYGGVVGGPDKNDKFWDIRSDWPETEVALDYNAPLLTLAALSVLTNPSDPYYTTLQAGAYLSKKPTGRPCDAQFSCHGTGSAIHLPKTASIALGSVLGFIGLVILVLAVWFGSLWVCGKRKGKGKNGV